eukprot:jgi/Bigna1/70167/fgenesh1_pg.11_\
MGGRSAFLPLLLLGLGIVGGAKKQRSKAGASDYCVIGAGPAGVQIAYFLQKASLSYVVFEREWEPASTFRKYPRHGRLISINKRYTGRNGSESQAHREYNLRHDWHSFLTTTAEPAAGGDAADAGVDEDLPTFQQFSERYFPLAEEYVAYVTEFVRRTKPRIKFGRNIADVRRVRRSHPINGNITAAAANMEGGAAAAAPPPPPKGHESDGNEGDELYHFQLRVETLPRQRRRRPNKNGVVVTEGRGAIKNEKAKEEEGEGEEGGAHRKNNLPLSQQKWYCKRLLVASGMQKETSPWWNGVELTTSYGNHDIDPSHYRNKTVAVVGGGNSAFEVIGAIMGEAASIRQYARERNMAENTHYPGSLRSANGAALDNEPVLRTQDAFFLHPFPLRHISIERESYQGEEKICLKPSEGKRKKNDTGSWLGRVEEALLRRRRHCFDVIIRCLGFAFDPAVLGGLARRLQFKTQNQIPKYPSINNRFEASGLPHLFFLGSNAHALDFKESSGGLVHGFRYQILNLFRHLRRRYHGVPWPHKTLTLGEDFKQHLIYRYGTASSLYQMFGVQCDVAVITSREGGGEVVYLYDVVEQDIDAFLRDIFAPSPPPTEYLTLSFEYMPEIENKLVWGNSGSKYASDNPAKPHNNQFVHPTIRYWNKEAPVAYKSVEAYAEEQLVPRATAELYLVEDLNLNYRNPVLHLRPLDRFLQRIRTAAIVRPDPEYSMSWFCDWCEEPDPAWRVALRRRCGDDRQNGVCKALL